jgi:hypothetical protein
MLGIVMALAVVIAPSQDPAIQQPFTQDGVPPLEVLDPKETAPVSDALAAAATPKNLILGDYALFAPTPKAPIALGPRFETEIEVLGSLPRDPNVVMADWWRHWNFEYSIYGRGINIQNPMPGGGYNLLPLFEWIGKKAKERSAEREAEERRRSILEGTVLR